MRTTVDYEARQLHLITVQHKFYNYFSVGTSLINNNFYLQKI